MGQSVTITKGDLANQTKFLASRFDDGVRTVTAAVAKGVSVASSDPSAVSASSAVYKTSPCLPPTLPPMPPALGGLKKRKCRAAHVACAKATERKIGKVPAIRAMSTSLKTMHDIYTDYVYGYAGDKPIRDLEAEGKLWRRYNGGRQSFQKRKWIFAEIDRLTSVLMANGVFSDEAVISEMQKKLDEFPLKGRSCVDRLNNYNKEMQRER